MKFNILKLFKKSKINNEINNQKLVKQKPRTSNFFNQGKINCDDQFEKMMSELKGDR